jgi:hypothetical protein
MPDIAKTLIIIGIIFILAGAIFMVLGKIPGAGKLSGDIFIKKDNFTFYFPLTTCLIISVVLTIIFYLLGRR